MLQRKVPTQFLGKLRVLPKLPAPLEGLEDLANNLWWSWNPSARALFREICPETWRRTEGNPVRFMETVSQKVLEEASKSKPILKMYDTVMKQYQGYLGDKKTWFDVTHGGKTGTQIAYFSAEFGLHESLPIYSGGLGVLAGDHCKSASDLGLPFVGVGLLYREGYFIQDIDHDGQQRAIYKALDWRDLPVKPALDSKNEQIYVTVDLPGRVLTAKVWRVQVGRNPLYLLDTDIDKNTAEDRQLTFRLYGGGHEMRIQQEILLGIGGVRALRALGVEPSIFHMNEGHSVFLGLERLREYMHNDNLAFRDAVEMVRSSTLFTTHTPVPAGNDAFPPALMEKYFRPFWESLGISRAQFLALGLDTQQDGSQLYSLTVLALNLVAMANGVSELHGHVSRAMWQHIWPDVPARENLIQHITNGVHTRTWLSIDIQELFDKYFEKNWRERLSDPKLWEQVDKIPDEDLWNAISKLRADLMDFVHKRVTSQHARFGESPDRLREWSEIMDKDTLTIGFARRFATYKRATLIFRDRERLARILNNPERPIQLIFAGKAHPADVPGQALIRQIQEMSREPEFQGKIIFLENYDMNIGRRLTSGVDVWLNNPRRPYEASGTSGMKVPLNGGLNCSILDGWWPEAFRDNHLVGWALGEERFYDNPDQQDEADAESIYATFEHQIAKLFYKRDNKGIPREWVNRVRESMKEVAAMFSTHRMVQDYTNMYYVPAGQRHGLLVANRYERARQNAKWKEEIRTNWPSIRIHAFLENNGAPVHTVRVREKMELVAEVDLGPIDPDDVQVEIYMASLAETGEDEFPRAGSIPMHPEGKNDKGRYVFRGNLLEGDSGEYGYTVRVVPKHPDLIHPNELGLISWANSHQH
ncbi:alpha-glucan family phosphorylase [bacterium]|nr:alpha-glucan family phosphorylase [bacterium]